MTENIIFYDTEFTDLDPRTGELISVGLVSWSGDSLYIELDYDGPAHPWVEKKVIPYLKGKKTHKADARREIAAFVQQHSKRKLGKRQKPYLMAYVNQFDAIYWYKLFTDPKKHPAHWIPIDFASILFAHGYDPESMRNAKFFKDLGVNKAKYKHHNALDDAKLLRETYFKFIKSL